MNDRELLLAAAKAAGLVVVSGSAPVTLYVAMDGCIAGARWNPLTDDGDALRLAVALSLFDGIDRAASTIAAEVDYDLDPCEATRLAIVRAAAVIGEAMP